MKDLNPFERACSFMEMNEKGISNFEIAKLSQTGEQMVSDYIIVLKEMKKGKVDLTEESFIVTHNKLRQENLLFCSCF